MNRSSAAQILLTCWLGWMSADALSADPVEAKLNVLFIVVDDLRPELGCYGHPVVQSPNIDRLAATGTLFRRAYCQQAVCAPSRASVLSGCRPDTTGIYGLQTPLRQAMPNVLTLPQFFNQNGYATIGIGKIYHHDTDDAEGWTERQRATSVRYYLPENKTIIRKKHAQARAKNQRRRYWHGCANATECADVADDVYVDGKHATMAIDALRRNRNRPLFLAVGFIRPHLPFCVPKRYWDLYDRDSIAVPTQHGPNGTPAIAYDNWGELRSYADIPGGTGPLANEKARELIHGYYACVSYIDTLIGEVLDELKRLDLAERTVVVLWGDHGWKLGEYGQWCKHTNFELDTRAPLIVRAPALPGTEPCDRIVEFVDIFPTLAELCGMGVPQHCEGDSLVPLLRDPDMPWDNIAISQYPRGPDVMGYSLRTDRWRYTEWIDRDSAAVVARELYDHTAGPLITENLALKPELMETMTSLSTLLKSTNSKLKQ